MSDDFRRELGNAFDQISGSPSPALSDRVRSSLGSVPERRGPYWIAGVATAVIAVLIITVLFVGHPFNRVPFTAGVGGNTSPSASASAPSSPSPSATPSWSPGFVCTTQPYTTTSAVQQPLVFIDALRTGAHTGYDRLTVEFTADPNSVEATWQASPTFTLSPSGQSVTLKGAHGILVTIHGADLHSKYSGPIDIVVGGAGLAEVRRVQDFEGVVQLGLGVNGTGCFHISWLSGPTRLVIDVQA